MVKSIKMTPTEIDANKRLKAIGIAIENLIKLCKSESEASIICSICIPASEEDMQIVSIYAGDTISHIQQFNSWADNDPQFLSDLVMFLDLRIKKQVEKTGTIGNTAADQLLADISKGKLSN